MSLTKSYIINNLYFNNGLNKRESTQAIETILEILKSTLVSGEDVMISGFGKFSVKEKRKRRGRNPATCNDLMLDARRIVTFRSSPRLRGRVNGI